VTKKVFALDTKSGIQRDGTILDKTFYNDGLWVRFQRGRPRKVGGYRQISQNFDGPSRGIFLNPIGNNTQVFNGYSNGLQNLQINPNGIGAGSTELSFIGDIVALGNLQGGSGYTNGVYAARNLTGGTGSSATANITVAGNVVTSVVLVNDGSGYKTGDTLSASAASIGGTGAGFAITVTEVNSFAPNANNLWQFDAYYDSTGGAQNQLLAHPGQNLESINNDINTPVLMGNITGTTMSALADTGGSSPTNATIEVSGGVVVLHPYIFVYGNDGLIKNCSAGDPTDWNSADSNEVSAAGTKIVKGLPVRGGSNSPSGLFWSLDSLIRVSYAPQSLGVAGTPDFAPPTFWRYDTISTQTSILSSQCVIEYDGIYYWIGVDRFMLYNGVVKEIPNDMNQNYFFDNLNYSQREKVWATKIPRYGEIWWFYPRGQAEECTDAIVFNVREGTWYDAGQALGARRSAGYFTQLFPYPVMAGWEDIGGGNVRLWQHEYGTDEVVNQNFFAIESYFETSDLSFIQGSPAETTMVGDNYWVHLERVEPDFLLSGEMELYVIGSPYAQVAPETSGPYTFDSNTNKIDLREQRRQLRLRFVSNTSGGNYQCGRIILNVNLGDTRGY
jgi:hypothetical protein